jgi:hypothetical protein
MPSVCTAEEWAWLEERYPTTPLCDLLYVFEAKFGHRPNKGTVTAHMSERGIKRDLKRIEWSAEMDEYFASIVPGRTESEIRELFSERFGIVLAEYQIANQKKKLGVKSGTKGGCFKKGNVPHNKGKSWDEQGISAEAQARSRATCFKRGNIPHNAIGKDIGYERVNRDGYIEVKVKDGLQGEANDNFRRKHHVVWEEANGTPVPKHTTIVFADRDKRNFDPRNLVAVPRTLWVRINQLNIPYWDRESLELAMVRARLASMRSAAEKRKRPCRKCGCDFAPRYSKQKTCDVCLGREVE